MESSVTLHKLMTLPHLYCLQKQFITGIFKYHPAISSVGRALEHANVKIFMYLPITKPVYLERVKDEQVYNWEHFLFASLRNNFQVKLVSCLFTSLIHLSLFTM